MKAVHLGAVIFAALAPIHSARGQVVNVPRVSSPVIIDGRVSEGEWRLASREQLRDGSVLHLQHDGRYLYIAIAPAQPGGFISACAVRNSSVRILHASAALGAVSYAQSTTGWNSGDTAFTYSMRATDTTEAVRQERRAYLEQHGWVASTMNMSQGRGTEMQVALSEFDSVPRLALAWYITEGGAEARVVGWPATLTQGEGCVALQLVQGYVPRGLSFGTSDWAELRLGS